MVDNTSVKMNSYPLPGGPVPGGPKGSNLAPGGTAPLQCTTG